MTFVLFPPQQILHYRIVCRISDTKAHHSKWSAPLYNQFGSPTRQTLSNSDSGWLSETTHKTSSSHKFIMLVQTLLSYHSVRQVRLCISSVEYCTMETLFVRFSTKPKIPVAKCIGYFKRWNWKEIESMLTKEDYRWEWERGSETQRETVSGYVRLCDVIIKNTQWCVQCYMCQQMFS